VGELTNRLQSAMSVRLDNIAFVTVVSKSGHQLPAGSTSLMGPVREPHAISPRVSVVSHMETKS